MNGEIVNLLLPNITIRRFWKGPQIPLWFHAEALHSRGV